MPETRYFLADVVLSSLLALPEKDCRHLFAAFDQIAENPRELATSMGRDWDGRLICVARHGRFEIGYVIGLETEVITITLLRPRSFR